MSNEACFDVSVKFLSKLNWKELISCTIKLCKCISQFQIKIIPVEMLNSLSLSHSLRKKLISLNNSLEIYPILIFHADSF